MFFIHYPILLFAKILLLGLFLCVFQTDALSCGTSGGYYQHFNCDNCYNSQEDSSYQTSIYRSSFTATYDTYKISGSLTFPQSTNYDVRLRWYANGKAWMSFDGSSSGSTRSAGCDCCSLLPSGTETISNKAVVVNRYYPFELKIVSGCSLYSTWYYFEYKRSVDSTWLSWTSGACSNYQDGCFDGYFGGFSYVFFFSMFILGFCAQLAAMTLQPYLLQACLPPLGAQLH
jgi:hypothetical protein